MRYMVLAAALIVATPALSSVQALSNPAASAVVTETTTAASYSTTGTDLGTLLDNPQTKAVLMKHIPEVVANEQIAMARQMTLRGVQQYAADMLPDAKLDLIDADLKKVAVK